MLSRWQEARCSASWWAHSSRRESRSGAASRPTGTSPSLRPPYQVRDRLFAGTTVGFPGFPHRMGEGGFRTRAYGSRATRCWAARGESPSPQPSPIEGEGVRGSGRTRGSAPTAGHARIPLPRVRGGQTRAYRRERLSASNIAYRRADTWVRPYGWSRAHPSPARQGGSNPRLQAGTAVRQHHRLPAGGHVGPPLRLVTRASLSRPSREGGFNPRLQAGTAVGQQHCLPAGGHVGPPLRLVTRASLSRPSREGGFQTRAYRRERLSASNIAYRRADTWVRPYGWSRAHPLTRGVSGRGVWSRWARHRGPARASAVRVFP